MQIDNPAGDPDCRKPSYSVSFDPRDVSDIGEVHPEHALQNVAQVSLINEAAYDLFLGPWLRAMTTPQSAEALRAMHPMRWSRLMFSARYNPWMGAVQAMADTIRSDRKPLPADDPAVAAERKAMARIGASLRAMRLARDRSIAAVFKAIYAPGAGLVPHPGQTSRALRHSRRILKPKEPKR